MLPSKEELKKQYHIENDDFEVLTACPSDDEVRKRGGFLVRVGELLGAPTWLWKNLGGIVLAVIIATSGAIGHYQNLKPIAVYSYETIATYFQEFTPIKKEEPVRYVAFVPAEFKRPADFQPNIYTDFPTGSAVFPVSGSWHA